MLIFSVVHTPIPALYSNIFIRPSFGSLDHYVVTSSINYTNHNTTLLKAYILVLQISQMGRSSQHLSFMPLERLLSFIRHFDVYLLTLLFKAWIFLLHSPKLCKPGFPQWCNLAYDRVVRFAPSGFHHWRHPLTSNPQEGFMQERNKCSATTQVATERFVCCKAERILSSATGSRTTTTTTTISLDFPLIYSPFSDLVCELRNEAEPFASRFTSKSTLINYATSASPSSAIPLLSLVLALGRSAK